MFISNEPEPRNLTKFSSVYLTKIGVDTWELIPPMHSLFQPSRAISLVTEISRELKANQDKRFLFHIFSSNGCVLEGPSPFLILRYYHYLLLLKILTERYPHLLSCIKGTIFDSCPSELTPETLAKAFVAILCSRLRLPVCSPIIVLTRRSSMIFGP
jgi:hypothetical protein